MNENSSICKQHSGFEARISDNERSITQLWEKWDSMNNKLIAGLVVLSLNLIGVIALLIRMSMS